MRAGRTLGNHPLCNVGSASERAEPSRTTRATPLRRVARSGQGVPAGHPGGNHQVYCRFAWPEWFDEFTVKHYDYYKRMLKNLHRCRLRLQSRRLPSMYFILEAQDRL